MPSKIQFGLIVLALVVTTSCTVAGTNSTYNIKPTGVAPTSHASLEPSKAVLVTTPQDGGYNKIFYDHSGDTVAKKLDASFARYAARVTIYPSVFHSVADLKPVIKKQGYGYIVVPVITHWEHHATAWSGQPSRASIKLDILDAKTGKEITSTLLEGESPTMTFESTSPEDLLPGMIDSYVARLYGQKNIKSSANP